MAPTVAREPAAVPHPKRVIGVAQLRLMAMPAPPESPPRRPPPMWIVMIVQPAMFSALRGMSDAARRMDVAAHNVANVSTEDFAPLRSDGGQGEAGTMDLASELVDATMLAPIAYTANATVIRAADETQRAVLDLRA
jgi:Flagella basal body rod protein